MEICCTAETFNLLACLTITQWSKNVNKKIIIVSTTTIQPPLTNITSQGEWWGSIKLISGSTLLTNLGINIETVKTGKGCAPSKTICIIFLIIIIWFGWGFV